MSDNKKNQKKPSKNSAKSNSPGKRLKRRPFPANSLEDALRIPSFIKDLNGGNPWPPSEIATALSIGPKTNDFYALTASSRDYGLTNGTRDSSEIELAELGKRCIYAASPSDEAEAIQEAFMSVELFSNVYEYYKGEKLPDFQYLQNTLETTFEIPREYHETFVTVYQANLKFVRSYETHHVGGDGASSIRKTPAILVGEPKGKTTQVAFVIMPFSEKTESFPDGFYDEVLKNLITPAAVEAGFKVETARREGSDIIQSTIVRELLAADLVIADLTDHNPNVLFELGLRLFEEKPTALIRAKGTKPIFDVDNMLRVFDYSPQLWRSTLENDVPALSRHLKATWENRDSLPSYMSLLKGTNNAV